MVDLQGATGRLREQEAMRGALAKIIAERIRREGPIDVGAFMDAALGHHEHGYYIGRDPFGVSGDFTTAPEISQMFGELVGVWIADYRERSGIPGCFSLIEAGPGRGTLMADLLRATKGVKGFHEHMSLHLLETSPALKEKQAEALAPYHPCWHGVPECCFTAGAGPIILVANEFFDALPVRQLIFHDGAWRERLVALDGAGALVFETGADARDSGLVPPHLDEAARAGDIYEYSPARAHYMRSLCRALKSRGGAALIVDYGHTAPGLGDTLQALRNHAPAGILDDPGEADVTAHVDFSALAAVAEAEGCAVHGPVGQGAFLKALGIEARAAHLCARADTRQARDVHVALQRLTAPVHMGQLFKVMAVTAADGSCVPAGFY